MKSGDLCGMTRLDAARGLVYGAAKTVDRGMPHRRLVSEAKKFSTEAAWSIINTAMQVLRGNGYTNVYPLERYLCDSRLGLIWTGTSQIMDALIQHEIYAEFLGDLRDRRNVEMDALAIDAQKKKFIQTKICGETFEKPSSPEKEGSESIHSSAPTAGRAQTSALPGR